MPCGVSCISLFQDLVEEEVPQFAANLSQTVQEEQTEIVQSTTTITAIVDILNVIADVSNATAVSVMTVG